MEFKGLFNRILHSQNFRHGMLYTLFSFVNNGISFILVLILAKFLMPTDYGQLNLFSTFVNLLNIIIALCTASYVAVSFFQKSKEAIQQIIIVVIGVATIFAVILSLAFFLFPSFFSHIVGVDIKYLWMGVLICYFTVFNNLNLDIWRVEEKPLSYGLYSLSFAICNFGLTFWLIVGEKLGWEGRVYAWLALGVVYFIVSTIFLIRRRYLTFTTPSKAIITQTLLFALPLIPHNASFWLKQGMDRYIINFFYDTSVVGFFSFSMNMAAIITMIGQAFNATNSVYSFKLLSSHTDDAKSKLQSQANIMTIVFSVVTVFVIIFAYLLIHFFLPRYSCSISYLIPLGLGAFFQCVYFLWVNYIVFYKKTIYLMYITLTTALIQIALSIWLTRYSPINTAWISMSISALTFILVLMVSKKLIRKHK